MGGKAPADSRGIEDADVGEFERRVVKPGGQAEGSGKSDHGLKGKGVNGAILGLVEIDVGTGTSAVQCGDKVQEGGHGLISCIDIEVVKMVRIAVDTETGFLGEGDDVVREVRTEFDGATGAVVGKVVDVVETEAGGNERENEL